MNIRDRQSLREAANNALAATPNHRKLVLIFVAVSSGLSLLASILSMVLESQIAGTGGLAGMGMRSVLSTVQSVLSLALVVLMPFWSLGYISVVLKLSRKKAATPTHLLDGFRRFGPALRLMLLRQLIYFVVAFICIQLASVLFSFTPWSLSVYQLIYDNQSMLTTGVISDATMDALTQAMIPMVIILGILYVAALIPVTYRLRMAELRLMDEPGCGAIAAIRDSNRMMRRNCFALFKLDLHFWWFYLVNALVTVLCYCDVLLPMLGISFPFSGDVAYYVFFVAAMVLQLLFYWYCRNTVECTYAKAYEALYAPYKSVTLPKNDNPIQYY